MEKSETDDFGELICVPTEAVNVADRRGRASITEEHGECVDSFRIVVVETNMISISLPFWRGKITPRTWSNHLSLSVDGACGIYSRMGT